MKDAMTATTTTPDQQPQPANGSTQTTALAAPPASSRAISAFSGDAAYTAALRGAKALAASTLVPVAYQNNPPNCMIAMELASRIGASVFAVMQSLDIIHGRPAWRATFLIATVNTGGRFTPLRFRWQGKEGTEAWGCRAVAKDRESGEECLGSLITIGLAAREGWTKKQGSKWLTMPEQMLMYRAAAFWTRVYAPELSLGMHTAEELRDSDDRDDYRGSLAQVVAGARSLEAELVATVPAVPPSEPKAAEPAPAAMPEKPGKKKAQEPPATPGVTYDPSWKNAPQGEERQDDGAPPDDYVNPDDDGR